MVYRFIAIGMLIISSVSLGALRKSVEHSRALTEVLSIMADIAAEGPSLSYFGWTETKSVVPDEAVCVDATRDDVAEYLTGLIKEMDWATPSQSEHLQSHMPAALTGLKGVLESDDLERCDWGFSEQMTYTKVIRFKNKKTDYQITFSEGYED